MIRPSGRIVVCCVAFALAGGLTVRPTGAQFAGITPQFPYAPAQAAPLGPITQGAVATWLGADNGAMAVFPDRKTTFWTFGDTFLGPPGATDRSFPRPKVVNTIALGRVERNAGTGQDQFNPYYYYRGHYGISGRTVTNNPGPFFVDPDAYSDDPNLTPNNAPHPASIFAPNRNAANPAGFVTNRPLTDAQVSRFWTGKPLFYNNKLFVFMSRYDYNGRPLGSSLARINNAVAPGGGPTDPRSWQVDFIKLCTVDPRDPLFAPTLGAEVVVADDQTLLLYGVISSRPGGQTFVTKLPLGVLDAAPNGADVSGSIQYRAEGGATGRWASSTAPGLPFGRNDRLFDPGIPGGGGFSVRFVASSGLWRNVYVDFAADPGYVSVQYGSSPFGPFGGRQRVFKFPELDRNNTPLDINGFAHGYNTGIYNPWLDTRSDVKCYMAHEIPAFSSDPDNLIALTYSVDDAGSKPPYPPGCQCAPGQPAHFVWDNNFYRVKGVPGQVPFPITAAGPTPGNQ